MVRSKNLKTPNNKTTLYHTTMKQIIIVLIAALILITPTIVSAQVTFPIGSGEFIMTASEDGCTNKLWSDNGTEIFDICFIGVTATSTAMTTSGIIYRGDISGGFYRLRQFNSEGNFIWVNSAHTDLINQITVDEQGNAYTASFDGKVRRVNVNTGNIDWTYHGHTDWVIGITYNEGIIWSVDLDGRIHKIDSTTGAQIKNIFASVSGIESIASSDEHYYIGTNDGEIQKRRQDTDAIIWVYTQPGNTIFSLGASDNDAHVWFSTGANVRRLNSAGTVQLTITPHAGVVWRLDVDATGAVYTAGSDDVAQKIGVNGIQIWNYTAHTGQIFDIKYQQVTQEAPEWIEIIPNQHLTPTDASSTTIPLNQYFTNIEEGLLTDATITFIDEGTQTLTYPPNIVYNSNNYTSVDVFFIDGALTIQLLASTTATNGYAEQMIIQVCNPTGCSAQSFIVFIDVDTIQIIPPIPPSGGFESNIFKLTFPELDFFEGLVFTLFMIFMTLTLLGLCALTTKMYGFTVFLMLIIIPAEIIFFMVIGYIPIWLFIIMLVIGGGAGYGVSRTMRGRTAYDG